jgi:hypothetical protein
MLLLDDFLRYAGVVALTYLAVRSIRVLVRSIEPFVRPLPPRITVPLLDSEAMDVLPHSQK